MKITINHKGKNYEIKPEFPNYLSEEIADIEKDYDLDKMLETAVFEIEYVDTDYYEIKISLW